MRAALAPPSARQLCRLGVRPINSLSRVRRLAAGHFVPALPLNTLQTVLSYARALRMS